MDPAYLEVILQTIDVGVVLIEGTSRNVVFANPAFLNMIDKQSHEVIGLSRTMLSNILRGLARDELELHNRFDAIPETGGYSALAQIELSHPRRRVIDWHARPVHLEKGGFGQVCVFVDVTDQIDRSHAEKTALQSDGLTRTLTRIAGEPRLEAEINRLVRFGWKGCLVLLDIDHFKQINDESGHQAGDSALQALGHAINQVTRVHDIAIRWGGDEFVLLLPSITPQGAEHVLTRLRNDAKLSISAGVGEIPEDGSSLSDLIKVADRRLYLAKRGGRNTTRIADEA